MCYNGVYSASVAACVRTTVPYCACHLMCLTYGQYHPDASSASQCGANPPIGEGDLAIAIRATDLFPAPDLFAPAFCRDELGWGRGFAEYGRMPESMREQLSLLLPLLPYICASLYLCSVYCSTLSHVYYLYYLCLHTHTHTLSLLLLLLSAGDEFHTQARQAGRERPHSARWRLDHRGEVRHCCVLMFVCSVYTILPA